MSKSPEAFRTISEVAEELDLPQHVLRFWETRFAQIKPMKRGGGRRFYRPDDVDLLRGIRCLLYGEGYTIRGVQRILKEQGPRSVVAAGRVVDAQPTSGTSPETETEADALGEPAMASPRAAPSGPGGPTAGSSEAAVGSVSPDPPSPAGLSEADAERLRVTLADLLECKRLLDQAR